MEKADGYIRLLPQEAKELIDREKDLILIDARTCLLYTSDAADE